MLSRGTQLRRRCATLDPSVKTKLSNSSRWITRANENFIRSTKKIIGRNVISTAESRLLLHATVLETFVRQSKDLLQLRVTTHKRLVCTLYTVRVHQFRYSKISGELSIVQRSCTLVRGHVLSVIELGYYRDRQCILLRIIQHCREIYLFSSEK